MDDSTVDQQSMDVSAPMPVEMESAELQQTPEAVAADPEAILELGPQHVVGTEDAALGQQLADQPLEADEGTISNDPSEALCSLDSVQRPLPSACAGDTIQSLV